MNVAPLGASSRAPLAAFLAVAAASAALLAWGTDRIPMTAAYQDRVSQIHAQDEATYSRVTLEMVFGGDWLTPRVLGRFFLYKPPLFYWFSGLSVKCLGLSRLSLRLPNVIAGAAAIAIVLAWCHFLNSWRTGLIGAVLMLSNSVWETMSRLACMDVLLASAILLALFFLMRDPVLARRSSLIGFGGATAAAIMTKSVAGAIPILTLAAFAILAGSGKRPPLRRIVYALAVVCVLAAPWHTYQLIAHRQWFVTEYITAQLFGFGAHPPVPSSETAFWFYARRLFATDPVLAILFLLGLPGLLAAIRRRGTPALILCTWLAVTMLAVCAFQARNFLYAVLLIPPLCLVAAGYSIVPPRFELLLLLGLVGLGIGKVYADAPWDLAFYRIGTPQPQLNLRAYADKGRTNELIVVDPDDEFYSMLLPIHGVRYCWIGQIQALQRYAPHLVDLGITMPSAQFIDLGRYQPQYEALLRRWDLDSSDPIATSIVAPSAADVLLMVHSRPASDFYLPGQMLGDNPNQFAATHSIEPALAGRAFLLSRTAPKTARWTPIPSRARNL